MKLLARALLVFAFAALAFGQEEDRAPRAGDRAPDFKLKVLGHPEREVALSSFQGKRPVVLIFGSFT